MPEPQDEAERLSRILDRLIELTEGDALTWETGAPPDSYAITVGGVRFRIRTITGDQQPPYTLDLMGVEAPQTGDQEALGRLYGVAKKSAIENAPDPFRGVEQQLGIIQPER